jgi:hypothetical protein
MSEPSEKEIALNNMAKELERMGFTTIVICAYRDGDSHITYRLKGGVDQILSVLRSVGESVLHGLIERAR